ncbi:hypothetical protein D3C73_1586630 [compost metagenome]
MVVITYPRIYRWSASYAAVRLSFISKPVSARMSTLDISLPRLMISCANMPEPIVALRLTASKSRESVLSMPWM